MTDRSQRPRRSLAVLTLCLFLLLALWDASGLDLPLARLFGSAQGFAWRDQPVFVLALHELPRVASGALLLALLAGVRWPWAFLRGLSLAQRGQLAASVVLAMLAVSLFKRFSATSCPWELAEFGGAARYVSHWVWRVYDQGSGHCFPAGHASSAFAYVACWFVLRRASPRMAPAWLLASLVTGLVLGVAQQMRGAHYLSHTLWTAWICWAVGLSVDAAAQLWRRGEAVLPGVFHKA